MKKQQKTFQEDDEYDLAQPFDVNYIPFRNGTYVIEINDTIRKVAQFSTAIQALGMAAEDDEIELRIQSYGGSLDAADAFIHALRKCKAHIHAVATGNVSSAATFILLESESFELSEGFNATLHCGSLGSGGAYNEYKQQTDFYNKFMPSTLRRYYQGFLTEAEIDDMLNGKDIILDAEGWVERYTKRNEYIGKKVAALMKEQKKAARKPKKPLDVQQ